MIRAEAETLLDSIYSAATKPSLWPTALERFADAVGGSGVWLSRLDVANGTGSGLIVRIDPTMPKIYLDHFAAINPFANARDPDRYIRDWHADVRLQDDWISREALVTTEYYNDFLRPQDVHSSMMVQLSAKGRETAVINVNRTRAAGGFDAEHVAFARRFRPHFARAFALSQRLAGVDIYRGDMMQALETIADAVLVLDRAGHIDYANSAALEFGKRRLGLRVARGRLEADNAALARELEHLLVAATARIGAVRTGGTIRDGRTGVTIRAAPIGDPSLDVFGGGPKSIVILTAPSIFRPGADWLKAKYGLTSAEIRVALALAGGASLRETAERFGVSIHTVRNQVQRLYTKTNLRRQSELVLLLAPMDTSTTPEP